MTERQLIDRIVTRVKTADKEGRTNLIIFQDIKLSKGVDVTPDLINHIDDALEGTNYRASYDTWGDCIYLNAHLSNKEDRGDEHYETC